MTMWKKRILARTIEIELENRGNHAFSYTIKPYFGKNAMYFKVLFRIVVTYKLSLRNAWLLSMLQTSAFSLLS